MTGHPSIADSSFIDALLRRIGDVRVAVYGDLCLDACFILDPRGSEVSVETGLQCEAVARHTYTPGGGANVVANVAALRPKAVRAIGAIGPDIFGRELRRQLTALGVDTSGVIEQIETFDTVVFGRRIRDGVDGPRLDYGFFNERAPETDAALLDALRSAFNWADAVIINQQVAGSMTGAFADALVALADEHPKRIVLLDSRHEGRRFDRVVRKCNAVEAARLCGVEAGIDDTIAVEDIVRYAREMYARSGRPVFCTRGADGMVGVDDSGLFEEPGIPVTGQVDPVGAGDTVASALACALAAGASAAEAARLANLAASVTVRKLTVTGTASPEEIRRAAASKTT